MSGQQTKEDVISSRRSMTCPQPLHLGRGEKRHARFRNTARVSGDGAHSDLCPGRLRLCHAPLSLGVTAGGCDSRGRVA